MNTSASQKQQFYEKDGFITFLFISAVLVILLGLGLTVVDWMPTNDDWKNPGIRGDFWGGHIGAFANLAAFIVLVAATLLQRKELMEARIINQAIAKETENQATALSSQIIISQTNQTYTNFFQLLTFVEAAESRMIYDDQRGRMFITSLASRLEKVSQDSVTHRENFQNLVHFISLTASLEKMLINAPNGDKTLRHIFNSKFNDRYLDDLWIIFNWYNFADHNLQELAPDIWTILQNRNRKLNSV